MPALDLSIVIPAYNEEIRLPPTLDRIHHYFRRGPAHEIIVVDDGSTDGTARVVAEMQEQIPELRLISNERNHGKGFSVRHGMLEAQGRIALFTDADLSSPIEEAEKLFTAMRSADIAMGSRALDRSLIEIHESRAREFAGIVFNGIVRLATGLRFADTQCGFKAFAMPECQIIFEQQRIADFGFDPEILYLAKRHGLRAVEVPVRWAYDSATKVNMARDSARMLLDVFRIRRNAFTGKYPSRSKTSASQVHSAP